MTLDELENEMCIKYPATFWKIYNSGAMEWLNHNGDWLNINREKIENNPKSFFYYVGGDCEPILFPDITYVIKDFLESLKYDDDFKLGKKIINPNYKFIPFAMTGGGDLYCFWYKNGTENPEVTLYAHDTGEMYLWTRDFDELLFIQLAESLIEYDLTFDNDAIKFHTQFLKDEYLKIFSYKDINKLEKVIKDMMITKTINYIIEV